MGVDIETFRSRVGCFASCRSTSLITQSYIDFSKLAKCVGLAFVIRMLFIMLGIETKHMCLVIGIETRLKKIGVRCFISCSGKEVMSLDLDLSIFINLIGALSFIRLLLVMSGIEQNPGPLGAVNMNDPEFKNWIKAAYGFKYLKAGLLSFVSNQVTQRYRTLKQNVAKQYPNLLSCSVCTSTNLLPDHANSGCNQKNRRNCFCRQNPHTRRICPNNFCSYFYHLIVDDHVEKTPRWASTDPTQWSNDYFQYAKCFLGTHSLVNSFNELDCTGILSIVIHNRHIHHSIDDVNLFKKCRENRNKVFHSGDYRVTDQALNDYVDDMINVLEDRKCLINDQTAQHAVINLNKLKTGPIHITDVDIVQLVQMSIAATNELRDEVKKEIEDQRNQVLKDFDSEYTKAISEIKKQRDDAIVDIKQAADINQIKYEDVKKILLRVYRRRCQTLPVSPIFSHKDEDLLNIYKPPTMTRIKYKGEESKNETIIKDYEEIFCNSETCFEEIYIVGDAGVGKTSFCTCMSLLWCYANSEHSLEPKYKALQKDVDYMSKFEFVFFVSLRDTCHTRVIDMIIEQLFEDNQERYRSVIDNILREKPTLILMDGLDEWMPSAEGEKRTYKLPVRTHSDKIVHLSTSRPYRIESLRLASKDVDHLAEIKGISGESSKSYVSDVIKYMNKENNVNKNLVDFISDMEKCKLEDLLCIPIIASHLVVLWFEMTMTEMSRALIYANILEMLFKRAELKGLNIPSSTESKFQRLPESVLGLKHLTKYDSLLYNVCHLSFRSLFKHDGNESNLVFTADELLDEPLYFTNAEIDFICQIGIFSKNEVLGCYSVEKLKLSFIHKSYIEFFSALFISSCDISRVFVERWKTIDNVIMDENLILLLVGFFTETGEILFDKVYDLISYDVSLCRRNTIFHYDKRIYRNSIKFFQNLAIKCFKELCSSNDSELVLKLEDFVFDDDSDVDILKNLLLLNTTCVKSVHSTTGKYYDVFDEIKNLEILHIDKVLSGDYVKFTKCMLRNQSTLHTVCIERGTILSELPVRIINRFTPLSFFKTRTGRSLHQLTSLSLCGVTLEHDSLHRLVKFLSRNVLIENITMSSVYCHKHQYRGRDCILTLNLKNHKNIVSLCLENILCNNVNISSLKYLSLYAVSEKIARGCIGVFNCISHSSLEHLYIDGHFILNDKAMRALTAALKSLSSIRSLTLHYMFFRDDVILHLNPFVRCVNIRLVSVKMSSQCFRCFIDSLLNNKSEMVVILHRCNVISDDGELSREESVNYMYLYLAAIPIVKITRNYGWWLDFSLNA